MKNKILSEGWKVEKLCDLAIVSAGQGAPQKESDYGDVGYPFIKVSNLEFLCNGGSEREIPKINDSIASDKKLRLYDKGTIIFAKSGMSCMKERVYALNESCYIVNHLACVTPKDINSKYLVYFLRKNPPTRLIKDLSYPSIRLSDIEEMEIGVPPLETQKKIVEILERAKNALEKRKEAINLLDELVKSRFIEMFGDPATNPMRWPEGTVRDIVTEVKYGTSKPAVEGGKYKYLRMNNITYNGELDISDLKYIDIPEKDIEKCIVRKGDVLFNRTNSKELVGKTCVFNLDEPMVIAGYIIRVRMNEKALPEYLSAVLNSKYGKNVLYGMCKAIVGQANINAQELQDIKLFIPPIELQKQYVEFIKQVDKLKFEMQESLRELENNFNSLMQRAFKGELFN